MELITYQNDLRKIQGLPVDVFRSSDIDPTFLIYLLLVAMLVVIVILFLIYKFITKRAWGKSVISNENKENHAMVQQKILDLLESGKINPQECAELLGAVSETKALDSEQEPQPQDLTSNSDITPEH
jgi:hypothetical protein